MRTRIISSGARSVQVLVKDDIEWESAEGLDLGAFIKVTQGYKMEFGSRLNRFAILKTPSGDSYFVWIAHHSIMDGWSFNLAFRVLHECFWDQEPAKISPYAAFIKHTMDLDHDAASSFWAKQLEGATRPSFPSTSSNTTQATFRFLHHEINTSRVSKSSVTTATVLRASWAMVLARHCNSEDVCFGATLSGRNADIEGLQNMAGPAIATIPVRVQLDYTSTVTEFLQAIQAQATDMAVYEQFGLQKIGRVSIDARNACQFSTLMIIRPRESHATVDGQMIFDISEHNTVTEDEMAHYFNYPLVLEMDLYPDHTKIRICYDEAAVSSDLAEALVHQLETVTKQLLSCASQRLDQISLVNEWDIQNALQHQKLQDSTDACIHEMIRKQIKATPDAPALTSWDGDMTYSDVGYYAEILASHLASIGVGPGVFVPINFSKSVWAVISMLAVNMAGGAFVPLDPSAPAQRQMGIIKDTKASLILTAADHERDTHDLGKKVLVIGKETILKMSKSSPKCIRSNVTFTDPSHIMFTSGSTGKPKGIVFEHRNICSTSDSHGVIQKWGPGTRVFTYSAYTFDIGVIDVMVALSRGACLCIPSEWQRYNDIHGAINAMQANWSFFTPTMAGLVNPSLIPTIKNVGLGGENVTTLVVDNWRGMQRFITSTDLLRVPFVVGSLMLELFQSQTISVFLLPRHGGL
uniref:AMP-dependent synthetase/ligase domain-containing protein n=1 Tax=Bionectria ochroleuca TaxID=29856 RepID=A0A8H7K873_BIOOC